MNKYLKKYQKTGEVKKLTYTEWCSENNELCKSDSKKAKALYEQYSTKYDMKDWSVSFNQSVTFGDDASTNEQNLQYNQNIPPRQWGFMQPSSVWTNSIAGPVTPLDVLPGVFQMGNAFKELFTPDPYRQAQRRERRRLRKLKKEQDGGYFQFAGETEGDLWDDDSSDDVVYGPFPEDYYDDDESTDLDPDGDGINTGIDATPYGDDGPDFNETNTNTDGGYDHPLGYENDDDLDYDNDGINDRGAITDGGWDREDVDTTARYSQDEGQGPPKEKKAFWDRKIPKFFRKFSHGLVSAAKPLNSLIRLGQTRKQMAQLNYSTIGGNAWAATPADMSGSKGDWTTNEGYFRPDDRIPVRSDFSRYGMETMSHGGVHEDNEEGLGAFIPENLTEAEADTINAFFMQHSLMPKRKDYKFLRNNFPNIYEQGMASLGRIGDYEITEEEYARNRDKSGLGHSSDFLNFYGMEYDELPKGVQSTLWLTGWKNGGELPKAQTGYGDHVLYNAPLGDIDWNPAKTLPDAIVPLGSHLLDLLSMTSGWSAEVAEGVFNVGDKTYDGDHIWPSWSGDYSFTNQYGEPQKTVSAVTGLQDYTMDKMGLWGLIPNMAVDIATDPLSYVGAGVVSNLIRKGIITAPKWLKRTGFFKNAINEAAERQIRTGMPKTSSFIDDYVPTQPGEEAQTLIRTKGRAVDYDDIVDLNKRLAYQNLINPKNPIAYLHGTGSSSFPGILDFGGLSSRGHLIDQGLYPMTGELYGVGKYGNYINDDFVSFADLTNRDLALGYSRSQSGAKDYGKIYRQFLDDKRSGKLAQRHMTDAEINARELIHQNRAINFMKSDDITKNILAQNYPMVFGVNPTAASPLGRNRFFSAISSDLPGEIGIKGLTGLDEVSNIFVPRNKISLTKKYLGDRAPNIQIKSLEDLENFKKQGGSVISKEDLQKASDGMEWLKNNYPGYDDLSASEKAQLNYQMKGTTYNFKEDLYNFQNPGNVTGPYSKHTNTMSYPFPEFMRHYDNMPGQDSRGTDWSGQFGSWDDNPNAYNYYDKRWSTSGDYHTGKGWGRTENTTQGVWKGHGTTVTDPITGDEVSSKRGPWEGYYSGYSWMPESGEINLNEEDWNTLVETGSYNPKYIDKRGRWSRAKNDYINRHSDAYMVWEDVLRRNYPELTTMQIHDLMHSGVHRTNMRGGRKGSPWAAGIPTPERMKDPDYKWGEYGDVIFDIRTTMPPGSREPGPVIEPTINEEEIVASRNQTPTTIPFSPITGISSGNTPNIITNNTRINPVVTTGSTTTGSTTTGSTTGDNITTGSTTGSNEYIPSRNYDYVPQSTRTREEMDTIAYGTSGKPQTQQDDTESAYVPQTTRKDEDEDEAKYGGFFYGNGGEAEIDINTYKQLIAAGADIEIL